MLSPVQLFVTSWTLARQVLLSIGFSRQEYWNGMLCALPGDLPDPGIEPMSPELQADSLPTEPPGKPNYALATTNLFLFHHSFVFLRMSYGRILQCVTFCAWLLSLTQCL